MANNRMLGAYYCLLPSLPKFAQELKTVTSNGLALHWKDMNEANTTFEKDACGVGFVYRPLSSNLVVRDALTALSRMEHRGACGADGVTGDGSGILTAIPWALFAAEGFVATETVFVSSAVGMVFLPEAGADFCREQFERFLLSEGFSLAAKPWRDVPLDKNVLGPLAQATCPLVQQIFVCGSPHWSQEQLELKLLFARKRTMHYLRSFGDKYSDFYIVSLSSKTIVYKGMVRSYELELFYPDLLNQSYVSQFAVYHRRFSTNTLPKWRLAQPFRLLGHNGEINTLLGNRNWMKCREMVIEHPYWESENSENLFPIVSVTTSDSGSLDNALELLVRLGRKPEAVLMQLIPDPVPVSSSGSRSGSILNSNINSVSQTANEVTAFYKYFAAIQEPWDGPALIVYSDGKTVGAKLDRNGMRPARFTVLEDGSVFLSSEAGVVDLDQSKVLQKGRLGPGQMLSVDIASGQLHRDGEVKEAIARENDYTAWLANQRLELGAAPFAQQIKLADSDLIGLQTAYGYGKEDIAQILLVMASTAHEAIYSMGDDTPLAVLSSQPRLLYDYFKQRFAQVTNPPIDHLREKLVMSLDSYLGRQSGWFVPAEEGAKSIHLASPILNEKELENLIQAGSEDKAFAAEVVSLLFLPSENNLDVALSNLCKRAVEAVRDHKSIIVLSDRGVNSERVAIPVLLAVAAVHHELIRLGLRLECSIVLETAQCWTTHHFACLFGYGAQAVCPYLAFEIVRHSCADSEVKSLVELSNDAAQANFRAAIEEGLQKVLSKMGISSLSSYIGAQIFECIGLGENVVERCFVGTPSRIGGLEIDDIERDVLDCHRRAFPYSHKQLINYGMMSSRPGGEYHGNNPKIVKALHSALGITSKVVSIQERQEQFREYSALVRERPPLALRDMLTFESDRSAIDLDQVEPAAEIVKRFCTGGMSLGALSKEAHEVLAIAMNRLGAKSNSGEGGEDPLRYYAIADVKADGTSESFPGLRGLLPGDTASSAVRQVASARFGVTPEYLVTAKQLEIKIAQGAKPGEGGQLPAHKVSQYIAKLRRAKEGMQLISPPPHHDIYSIEDLSQLIYDLRQVSAEAQISVKLVAEVGIGAVAVGVAKANADIVQVSGNDGGTGASALSSIKHAGAPWELGLVEVHRALLGNDLRHRVLLRVDGGLRSGWEVVMAAMLGANEFGFGSIALIAEGCIMARVCHTNNCPVGITSQKEKLREKFTGIPEQIVEFFLFIAEEVRMTLAQLGYSSLHDVLGRAELLMVKPDVKPHKVEQVNLDFLLEKAELPFAGHSAQASSNNWRSPQATPHRDATSLNDQILADDEVQAAIANHTDVVKAYAIKNTDRSVGARIGGSLAKLYGDTGFKGRIALRFRGSAGQSFGAFIVDNIKLTLTGEANDYVGKGMSGGTIVIKFPSGTPVHEHSWLNVIAGNTCLYGATGGALYCAGQAGERFAVRNSGAVAVVEGSGDHCCEYMTGGAVAVLGPVGHNFGAGMTGGLAFVLASDSFAAHYCGEADKRLTTVTGSAALYLRQLIERHHQATGSVRALEILQKWEG
ncbi:glutamate synthase-related protein [soil metagenome]